MAAEVLQSKLDISQSRAEMRAMGIDCTSPFYLQIARKVGLTKKAIIADHRKSWDILKTVKFIRDTVKPDAPILDIGAYASEMLCALHRLGHSNLSGVDLNREVVNMPYADAIRYVLSDFMHMPFKDSSFEIITAISVIEHGFQGDALLDELSRVVKPGGYFIASVDYWPDKINTDGIRAFGMDWRIFSKDELLAFFILAGKFGFSPVGELNLSASNPIISWEGKQYTFSWFVIQKHV
jgi:SAM-dependent methyltransferase